MKKLNKTISFSNNFVDYLVTLLKNPDERKN